MKNNTKSMTEGKPWKLIISFALPLMLGNIFQQTYTIVDTAVVGRFVGVNALAALGAADWLNFSMVGLVTGFSEGFSILVSHMFGAKNEKDLKKTVAMIIVLAVVIAFSATLLSQIFLRPVLTLMNTPPQAIKMAELYLRIMFSGLAVVMAYNASSAILRAMGDSKTPLAAMIIAALINVGLDLLFVVGFKWGIAGAAAATLIAQVFSFLFCLRILAKMQYMKLKREHFKLEKWILLRLIRFGLPTALQNLIIAGGGLVVQSVINSYDVIYVAGFTAANKLYGLLEVSATSFGFATTTYTGQNLGAGKYSRIRRGMKSSVLMAVVTSVFISAVILIFGRFLIGIFLDANVENAAKVISIGYRYLSIMAAFLVILYMLYVHRSGLMGLGDSITPMISGIVELVMRVLTILILPALIGERGLFYAEVTAWSGAAVILVITFYYRLHRLPKVDEGIT